MVWATKQRLPLLKKPQRYAIIKAIRKIGKEKGIRIVEINGHLDHLHALISLTNKQSMSEVAQAIKGGSSYWATDLKNYMNESLFKAKAFTYEFGYPPAKARRLFKEIRVE